MNISYFTKVESPPLEFFQNGKTWREDERDDHVSFFLLRSTIQVSFLWNLVPRGTKIAKTWGGASGYLLYHHITLSPSCMRQVAITTVCSLLARAMSEENAGSATYVGMQIAAIRSSLLTRCLIHNPKHKDHLNRMNVNEPVYILFRCIILYIEIWLCTVILHCRLCQTLHSLSYDTLAHFTKRTYTRRDDPEPSYWVHYHLHIYTYLPFACPSLYSWYYTTLHHTILCYKYLSNYDAKLKYMYFDAI